MTSKKHRFLFKNSDSYDKLRRPTFGGGGGANKSLRYLGLGDTTVIVATRGGGGGDSVPPFFLSFNIKMVGVTWRELTNFLSPPPWSDARVEGTATLLGNGHGSQCPLDPLLIGVNVTRVIQVAAFAFWQLRLPDPPQFVRWPAPGLVLQPDWIISCRCSDGGSSRAQSLPSDPRPARARWYATRLGTRSR